MIAAVLWIHAAFSKKMNGYKLYAAVNQVCFHIMSKNKTTLTFFMSISPLSNVLMACHARHEGCIIYAVSSRPRVLIDCWISVGCCGSLLLT